MLKMETLRKVKLTLYDEEAGKQETAFIYGHSVEGILAKLQEVFPGDAGSGNNESAPAVRGPRRRRKAKEAAKEA